MHVYYEKLNEILTLCGKVQKKYYKINIYLKMYIKSTYKNVYKKYI